MITQASADALTVLDPLKAAIMKLDEGRANALLNEMGILAAARGNIRGLQDIASTVITTLAGRKDILMRLVGDLAHDDVSTLRTVRDTVRELTSALKELAATNKMIQESQRLLVGMPQRIEERRGGAHNEDEIEARTLARMASMLSTKLEQGQRYDGEETGEVQEAEFTTAPTDGKSEPDPGEEKANEEDPTA